MQTVFDYRREGELGEFSGLVLLSQSPRRKELLSFLEPEIASVEVDERAVEEKYMSVYENEDFLTRAAKTCCEISMAKSDFPLEAGKLYLSADTIVVSDDKIFNKPKDLEEAKQMLMSHLGKSHYVVTSVCLRSLDYLEVFYTLARIDFVQFYPAIVEVIDQYITNKQPLDKAGAYGIQELEPRLIKGIVGDIHTIIGLPVAEIAERLFAGGKN